MNFISPGRAERVQTSGKLATIAFGPQTLTSSIATTITDHHSGQLKLNGLSSNVDITPYEYTTSTKSATFSTDRPNSVSIGKDISSIENSFMPKVIHDGSSKINLERLYDDPCELLDEWNTPVRLPRSRSWLCCPQANKTIVQDQPLFDRSTLSSYEHSHLITEPPKLENNHSIVSNLFVYQRLIVFFYNIHI